MATSTSSLLSPLLAQTPLLSPPSNFLETLSNYPQSVEELQVTWFASLISLCCKTWPQIWQPSLCLERHDALTHLSNLSKLWWWCKYLLYLSLYWVVIWNIFPLETTSISGLEHTSSDTDRSFQETTDVSMAPKESTSRCSPARYAP